jgi:hypothetical protein
MNARIERMYHPLMPRRCVVIASLVVVLAACGDDEDGGSGGPAREGTSGEWAEAWTRAAEDSCGGAQCAVFSARDEAIPAADAEPGNFDVRYDPAADPEAAGWAAVQDFADEVGCVLPEQPITPTPINCAAG